MNEGSKTETRESFLEDVRRLQAVALYCGMTTGIRLRLLREVLGHSSHSTLDYYVTRTVRDTLSAQMERPDKGGGPSAIRRMAVQQRLFAWLTNRGFDIRPLNEHADTHGGSGRLALEHTAASAAALYRQREDLGRVDALRAHLAALDEQLRPIA